jgi:hypothetical protein
MAAPLEDAGWARWAFLHGMLGWGIPVALGVFAWDTWAEGREATLRGLGVRLAIFMAGGILWGLAMKWWSDRRRAGRAKGET